MLILTRQDVEAALDETALLDAVSAAFQALSAGTVESVPRSGVDGDGGTVLIMGGRTAGSPVAVKLVGVFPGNAAETPVAAHMRSELASKSRTVPPMPREPASCRFARRITPATTAW